MWTWAFRRLGPLYIPLMMLVTRVMGSVGGLLTIYYVNITLSRLPEAVGHSFNVVAAVSILAAFVATTVLALCLTRRLRQALQLLREGQGIDPELATAARHEAVRFVGRQIIHETWLVPLVTTFPVCVFMSVTFGVGYSVLYPIAIATLLGITLSLMLMFFAAERGMRPILEELLHHLGDIDAEALPRQPLYWRINIGFSVIIICTATMIGALAHRRALDIVEGPGDVRLAVISLRQHTVFISAAALTLGLICSRLLALSITTRVGRMVSVMKRVQAGELSRRVAATGNDEIDILARQFNKMVENLEQKDRTVRDLNSNLERKVRSRTEELAENKRSLQTSLEKLRESDRHKTEFFSNVSHELRTPLMMILSPLEQVSSREGAELSDKARSLIDVAALNANRLLKLINQLLDFAKLEAGHATLQRSHVDVNRLIERLVSAARPLAEQRGLTLSAELDASLPTIIADEEKLDTVLTNLVSNALKFTHRGGAVCISAGRRTRAGRVRDDEIIVAVADTGIGIAPENLDRLFQRFVQIDGSTSRAFAGTGLGLALVKELVELHGGEIHVDSQPERGSVFWFTVPVEQSVENALILPDSSGEMLRPDRFADLAQVAAVPTTSAISADSGDLASILVVDDTPEVRQVVGEILTDFYRVIYAADGESGWEAVLEQRPDLIISDVMMPRVDGYELCRRVKEHPETAAIPFVLLTARAQLSLKIEGLNSGADDYLVKPFHSDELLARVRSLLRLRQMHGDLAEKHNRLEQTVGELRRTQHQLVQSEKLNSLGQLVAGVAHEINNAINAVCNGVPAINDRMTRLERLIGAALDGQPAEREQTQHEIAQAFSTIRRLSGVVEEGADRTARIVKDMKMFAHPGGESVDSFDLNVALDLCVSLLDKQFGSRVVIHREYEDGAWIRAPYGQLNQVFLNLLTNAVQAMREAGEIYIGTRLEADRICISIRDTGCGIPERVMSRIFDPFFTTKPPGQGTGLGLSVSYGIVTGLGGTIECHSLEGIGTEFIVRLPSGRVRIPRSEGDPSTQELLASSR